MLTVSGKAKARKPATTVILPIMIIGAGSQRSLNSFTMSDRKPPTLAKALQLPIARFLNQ